MEIKKLAWAGSQAVKETLSHWDIPESSPVANTTQMTGGELEPELAMSNWLYDVVRRNIKRGRVFQLKDVLLHRQADCLGYAKLMDYLGQGFALNTGIIEVVIDNSGRYISHYVNLVKLSSGRLQFMDLWYGSRNVKHRRIGAEVKEDERWWVRDLDWGDLEKVEDIRGLPATSVDGITYYILGNRHLERGIRGAHRRDLDRAIASYKKAIHLYPGYARAYFNRAIAYENEGKQKEASLDYAEALRDEASQIRVLAREHEDVIKLMELDRAEIGAKEQEIYLLHNGFITSEQVASVYISKQYEISTGEVDKIIATVEAKIGS